VEPLTTVLVTHPRGFAAECADRVVFVDAGVVLEEGPPERVLRDPREPRTREFLRAVLEAR
jgi:ABC-type polar amino acid transport system ATPase subunit